MDVDGAAAGATVGAALVVSAVLVPVLVPGSGDAGGGLALAVEPAPAPLAPVVVEAAVPGVVVVESADEDGGLGELGAAASPLPVEPEVDEELPPPAGSVGAGEDVPPDAGAAAAGGVEVVLLPSLSAPLGGAPVPALLSVDPAELEVDPAEPAGVLEGADAGLPRGVAVTAGGVPVALGVVAGPTAGAADGTADASSPWRAVAWVGPGRGRGLSVWPEPAATEAMAAAVRSLATTPVALSPETASPAA
ncbi:MAG: hypothetical protein ACXVE4_08595, partial [Solirubrobacteraceae bacterium]